MNSENKANDLISVIVPIYKVEKYLNRCVDSILSQTYKKIEIILVDDGSPDACGEICDRYIEKDTRIKVIHKENGGLSDARNAGIEAANGEYIIFVDSDDHIVPTMIEKMIEALIASKADLCICNINYVDENGAVINNQNMRSPINNGIYSRDDMLNFLVNDGYWFYVTAWNKLYKANVFRNIRFRVGKYHEDEFLIHEIIDRCDKVVCLEDMLYNYVQREGSIMQDEKLAFRHLQVLDAFEERIWLSKSVGSEELTRKLKRAYFWDIEVWYYFMRTIYKVPWYRLYGFFAGKMWGALLKYGNIWGKRKILKYFVFAFAPELYLKYLYK